MRKLWLAVICVLLFAVPVEAKLQIVATMPWIGSLASELGGNRVSVQVLVKAEQDPHEIEAKPSMILAARKADLFLYNGLDLEIGYLPLLLESSRNPAIQPGKAGNLDCSLFVAVLERHPGADRSMGDVHPLGNPHYHLSAANVLQVVRGMARSLETLDPGGTALYRKNLATFEAKWRNKQRQWSRIDLRGKRFAAYHRFFEYLAQERGFQIMAYVEEKPGIPPSARYLNRLTEDFKRIRPDAVLTTAYSGKREIDALARKSGIRGIVVPHDVGSFPGVQDWFALMDAVLSLLR